MRRKFLALILSVSMVGALLSTSALAADEDSEQPGDVVAYSTVEEEEQDETEAEDVQDEAADESGATEEKGEINSEEPSAIISAGAGSEDSDIKIMANDAMTIDDDEYNVVKLNLNQSVSAEGGEEYDYYSFTPTESGLYYFYTSREVRNLTLYYYYSDGDRYLGIGGDSQSTGYLALNAGTTYYLRVQNDSDSSYGAYEVTVTGTQESDNAITLDVSYSITGPAMTIYTYTPEKSGVYMFTSDAGSMIGAYTFYTSDFDPDEIYSAEAEGSMSFYMEAGQTYYLIVYSENADSVMLTTGVDDFINYFTKTADKTSAGSGDKIEYTMQTQVVEPTYSELEPPMQFEENRDWDSDDFTLTFHDTLDEGLELDEDSFVVKYYKGGSGGTVYTISDDNLDHNILDIISTDTTDGDSFEVTIDLTEMYWTKCGEGDNDYYIWDFSELEDSYFEVTYEAALAKNVTPGVYNNTAHVSSVYTFNPNSGGELSLTSGTNELTAKPIDDQNTTYEDVSDEVAVPVATYGLVIYKYDSDTWPDSGTVISEKPSWIPDETVPLAGAEFELYDADGNLLGTLVTDSDGCAYSTSMLLDGETVSMTFADGTELFIKEIKAPDGYILDDDWAEGFDFMMEAEYAESDYWYWGTVGNAAAVFDVMIYKYADGVNTNSGGGGTVASVLSRVGADPIETYDVDYNNPLVGVEFTLSRETDDGIEYVIAYSESLGGSYFYYVITDWTTDKSQATTLLTDGAGYLEFENLPAGTYTLTETAAPDGYYQLSDSIVFTVDSTGRVTVESGPADTDENEYGNWITVANEAITGKLELDKTDENGNNLSGAEFILGAYADYDNVSMSQIQSNVETYAVTDDDQYEYYYFKLDYDEESGSYVWDENYWYDTRDEATVMTTGTDGTLKITNLMTTSMLGGTYFLIETNAPEGYNLLGDPIVFTVSDDFTIQIAVSNDQASMNDDGTVMTVVDEPTYRFFPMDEEIVPHNDDEEDPDSWVKRESVNEYDAIEIEMSTTLPKMDGSVLAEGDFSMMFHNQLDTALVLDELESDFKVDINGQPIDEKYYEIDMTRSTRLVQTFSISDGCTFHVNVDLTALYNDGVIGDEDLGTATIRVFFYVDLETTDVNSSYVSTAWYDVLSDGEVLYTSDTSVVAVYTFEIIIDKYDTENDEPLADATFGLYYDEDCENAVSRNGEDYTVTSDEDGQAMFVGIAEGPYYLKELEAPEGYDLIEDPVPVTLEGADEDEEIEHIVGVSIGNTPSEDERNNPKDPEKTADVDAGASVMVGEEINYTISYYNHNDDTAMVTIKDALDSGLDFVSATEGGSYDADTHTVTWTIADAASHTEGNVTVTVKVNETALKGGIVTNTASVKIEDGDVVDSNTVEIPVTEKSEGTTGGNGGTGTTKTGDMNNLGVWLALLFASVAILLVGSQMRKKNY